MKRKALFEEQLAKAGLPWAMREMVSKLHDTCFDDEDKMNPCIDENGFYKDPMACDIDTLKQAWENPLRQDDEKVEIKEIDGPTHDKPIGGYIPIKSQQEKDDEEYADDPLYQFSKRIRHEFNRKSRYRLPFSGDYQMNYLVGPEIDDPDPKKRMFDDYPKTKQFMKDHLGWLCGHIASSSMHEYMGGMAQMVIGGWRIHLIVVKDPDSSRVDYCVYGGPRLYMKLGTMYDGDYIASSDTDDVEEIKMICHKILEDAYGNAVKEQFQSNRRSSLDL